MATFAPKPNQRLVSLRRRFLWLLIGVVGLFAAGMTLSLVFSLRSDERAEMRLLNAEAAQAKANVMRHWVYTRGFVNNLARDPELIDQMLVGTIEDRQEWAVSRQRLVPSTLGLALVSPAGEVYGDPRVLRVGPRCQRELREQGTHVPAQNPIHRDMPGLEHVDLITVVHGPAGETLGKVFVSVRLQQLKHIIDDSTQPGHAIRLLDAKGQPVVSSGTLPGAVREVSVPLPDIGWRLVVQSPIGRLGHNGGLQILAGLLTLAGVLFLLVMVVMRLRRPLLQEINSALDALDCLTRNESAPLIETRYVEFAHAAEDINRIAQNLHDQREQLDRLSHTDSLTGLPNRRAFETQFPHMLSLAERGRSTALVLLDIDLFKTINDRLGHAAGDQALIALANTLKALTRSSDMAARLAGDEFVVLLSGLDNQGVLAWYQRLADRFKSELRLVNLAVDNTISAGQTWLQEVESDNIGRALARADRALYQAKERGRGQLMFAAALGEKDAG
jgi:diguanylate cyclase (GGDEF)-like protein